MDLKLYVSLLAFSLKNFFSIIHCKVAPNFPFLFSFLKDSVAGYKILGWQVFFFQRFEQVIPPFSDCDTILSTVSDEKSAVNLTQVPVSHLSLATLKIFS